MKITWLSGIYNKKFIYIIICKLCYKYLYHAIHSKCVCVYICFLEIWLLPEYHCTEPQ